jgi:hypothetical protein
MITKIRWFNSYKIKKNITKVIRKIPKEKYKNIFKGALSNTTKIKQQKLRKTIDKIGV